MRFLLIQLAKLGDIVQSVPLARRLRARGEVWIAVNKLFHRAAEELGVFDRVIPVDIESPALDVSCDVVYNLNLNAVARRLASLLEKKGLRVVGWRGEKPDGEPWQVVFMKVIERFRRFVGINLVDLFLNLDGAQGPGEMKLDIEPGDPCLKKPYVVVHPFTRNTKRNWSYRHFSELSSMLLKEGFNVAVTGSEREGKVVKRLFPKGVVNMCGKTSVAGLYALIKGASFFISCDTGPIHIAAAAGVKVIGIYLGPAFFPETSPYTDKLLVLHPRLPCYPCFEGFPCVRGTHCRDELSPKDVLEAVLRDRAFQKGFFDGFGHSLAPLDENSWDALRLVITEHVRALIRRGYRENRVLLERMKGLFGESEWFVYNKFLAELNLRVL